MDYRFDFVVEDLTHQQAEELLDDVIQAVEKKDFLMGGGFYEDRAGFDAVRLAWSSLLFEVRWAIIEWLASYGAPK